jgi:hypothetical protein
MINKEGKQVIEKLRKDWVISPEEELIVREQRLLQKLYECQDDLEHLLALGKKDPHYISLSDLITNLEKHLGDQQDIM